MPASSTWWRADRLACFGLHRVAQIALAQLRRLHANPLFGRARLPAEAVQDRHVDAELDEVRELRRWQRSVLGEDFLKALRGHAHKPI